VKEAQANESNDEQIKNLQRLSDLKMELKDTRLYHTDDCFMKLATRAHDDILTTIARGYKAYRHSVSSSATPQPSSQFVD
jgi:hypothetical protein